MNLQNVIAVWKELRTTVVVVIVLFILFGIYSSFKAKQASQLKTQLAKQQQIINDLKKSLEAPAQGKIVYVEKPVVKTKYVPYYITQSVLPPTPVTIAKDDLCKIADQNNIAIKVAVQNHDIYCQTDFCNPNDSFIKLKAQAFTDISNITDHSKPSVWRLSALAGYEVIGNKFALGFSFLDWHNMILGANLNFDFKKLNDTEIGAFVGYRPVLWNRKLNVSLGVGPVYGYNGWGGQALIMFNWWN